MSVIALRVETDRICIAADSYVGNEWSQRKDTFAKLRDIDGFIIGTSGSAEEGNLMFLYAKTHKPKAATYDGILEFMCEFATWAKAKTADRVVTCRNHYLMIVDGRGFEIQDFFINEVHKFSAIGAGYIHAGTALYLGKTVEQAIDVACELSPWCEKPIITFEAKRI